MEQQVEEVRAKPKPQQLTSEDQREVRDRIAIMREIFAKQKKVTIRVREQQWVQVNDYTFVIAAGEKVEVPEQIADMLEEAGRL